MSGHPTDQVGPIQDSGDKGAGSAFNISDMGGIFKATANMFSGAQDTLNKAFGPVSDLLPFTDHGGSKGT